VADALRTCPALCAHLVTDLGTIEGGQNNCPLLLSVDNLATVTDRKACMLYVLMVVVISLHMNGNELNPYITVKFSKFQNL